MMWARRHLYPPNWKAIARAVKEQAGWRCVRCHVRQGAWRKSKRTGRWYRVWLHDTLNPHPALQCLCPTCHGRYDYRQRQREARISLERLKHRSLLKRRPVSPPKEHHPDECYQSHQRRYRAHLCH